MPSARPVSARARRPDAARPAVRAGRRRSRATWPRSSPPGRRGGRAGGLQRRAWRPAPASSIRPRCCSTAACFKSPLLRRAHAGDVLDALARRPRAAQPARAARGRRPRPRGRARRRVLRLRAARPRRAHPRRHRARVLRRRRERDARGARHRAAGAGAVRRAVRHGGGHRGRAAGARARAGGRRAGALPLLRLVGAARGRASARCSTLGDRRAAGARRDLGHAAARGPQPRRGGAGAAARPRHRGRHARARGRAARRRASAGRSSSTCASRDAERTAQTAHEPRGRATSSASTSAPRTPSSPTRRRRAPASRRTAAIRLFAIEQLVAPGEVAARPLLPSLRYHPAPGELAAGGSGAALGAGRATDARR